MNTREKIKCATDNTRLYLHKEGIFYKLYNRQAMLFVENVKELSADDFRGEFTALDFSHFDQQDEKIRF